jgi:hypothetical protein
MRRSGKQGALNGERTIELYRLGRRLEPERLARNRQRPCHVDCNLVTADIRLAVPEVLPPVRGDVHFDRQLEPTATPHPDQVLSIRRPLRNAASLISFDGGDDAALNEIPQERWHIQERGLARGVCADEDLELAQRSRNML